MLSRNSIFIITIIVITVLVLMYDPRIGAWPDLDEPYYHHSPYEPHSTNPSGQPHLHHHRPPPSPPPSLDWACEGFPDTTNVLLVMKTGASEVFARVPTQLMTVLKCLPDYLIFSDMDQNIGGQQIYDSLSTVLYEAQEGNSDFDLYRRQRGCLVDQENCNKQGNPAQEGRNLDKYKFVHIAEKAYAMRPGYDWYLFVEADTYVLWPNLVQWLEKLDPTKKLYLGSVTLINDFSFGHGGSGYIVSNAAMEALVGEHPGVANEWDVRAKHECCGDYIVAMALKDKAGVGVQQMWPTMNGEKPATLPFGPSHWCQPIVTMHHMNSEEINTFWHFERRRQLTLTESSSSSIPPPKQQQPTPPLLLKDIYEEFLAPHLNATREEWDNAADNRYYLASERAWPKWQIQRTKKPEEMSAVERRAHESFEACGTACKSLPADECLRYMYRNGVCSMSNSFVLGKPVKKEKGANKVMSGWDVEKIHAWIQEQGDCGEVRWPEVKVES